MDDRQRLKGVNTGVYLNALEYSVLLELQAKLQLKERKRITLSEVWRIALRSKAQAEGIAA